MSKCIIDSGCSDNRFHIRDGVTYCNRHYLQVLRTGKVYTTNRDKRHCRREDGLTMLPLNKLANKGYALIDSEKSYLEKDAWRLTSLGYVIRSKDKKFLHRLIMNPSPGHVVDHINGNPLDNRRSNLRICKQSQNMKNLKLSKVNKSGAKGVSLTRTGKFIARIKVNYVGHCLGTFQTLQEASDAYDNAAVMYFNEFARLNSRRSA